MKKFVIAIVMALMIAVNAFSFETYKFSDGYKMISGTVAEWNLDETDYECIDEMLELGITEFVDKGTVIFINPSIDKGSMMDKAFRIIGGNSDIIVGADKDDVFFMWYWYKGNQIEMMGVLSK